MGDQIKTWQQDGMWSATIEGIAAGGSGETEADAIRSLCNLLGSFVKGHAGTIDSMRDGMRKLIEPSAQAAA